MLDRHGLAASRERGQNFLLDPDVADRLAESAGIAPDEVVLEIGTGLGILTRALARRAARVITVEVDAGVVRALEAERLLPDTVRLLHRDALDLDLGALMRDDGVVRIVANLPYSVATPLLRRFLDHAAGLSGWSVLVQREMGERLTARTGTRDYGSLAVLHQLVADVRRGVALPASCFYPVPRVVSRFVHVVPREGGALDPERLAAVERVARAGFAHRRKTLVNSLRTAGATALGSSQLEALLGDLGVDVRARAESLPPGSWPLLERALAAAAAAS